MALFLIFLCVWPSIYMQNQLQAYRNAYLSYYIIYIYIIPFHIIFRYSFSSAVHRFFTLLRIGRR